MSYEFYKTLHFLGLIMTFGCLIGIFFTYSNSTDVKPAVRKMGAIGHGIGLLLLLASGFGLAHRMGYLGGLPTWIYVKFAIWLLAGGLLVIARKKAQMGLTIYLLILGVALSGILVAINKPFGL